MQKEYQRNFSELYGDRPHYKNSRIPKAKMTLSILREATDTDLNRLQVLEIGCHKGEISHYLAPKFREYFAIDIDLKALEVAKKRDNSPNLHFNEQNAEDLNFKNESFDVVICSHIYEHTPHPEVMIREIRRVLKPGGICYFSADNKYRLVEPRFDLPFLSWLPKNLAHQYLRVSGNGDYYYETLYSYSQLRELVREFTLEDYTLKVIRSPEKYGRKHPLFKNGSILGQSLTQVLKIGYRLIPTYLWVLRKEG